MTHQLGDEPIQDEYRSKMEVVASALDGLFNGDKHGDERHTGFILLVFPYGEREGRCNYISNGADRNDVVKLLKEQAKRFEEDV